MALLAELRELYLGKVDMLQEMEQITAEQQMQSGTDSKFRPDSTLE